MSYLRETESQRAARAASSAQRASLADRNKENSLLPAFVAGGKPGAGAHRATSGSRPSSVTRPSNAGSGPVTSLKPSSGRQPVLSAPGSRMHSRSPLQSQSFAVSSCLDSRQPSNAVQRASPIPSASVPISRRTSASPSASGVNRLALQSSSKAGVASSRGVSKTTAPPALSASRCGTPQPVPPPPLPGRISNTVSPFLDQPSAQYASPIDVDRRAVRTDSPPPTPAQTAPTILGSASSTTKRPTATAVQEPTAADTSNISIGPMALELSPGSSGAGDADELPTAAEHAREDELPNADEVAADVEVVADADAPDADTPFAEEESGVREQSPPRADDKSISLAFFDAPPSRERSPARDDTTSPSRIRAIWSKSVSAIGNVVASLRPSGRLSAGAVCEPASTAPSPASISGGTPLEPSTTDTIAASVAQFEPSGSMAPSLPQPTGARGSDSLARRLSVGRFSNATLGSPAMPAPPPPTPADPFPLNGDFVEDVVVSPITDEAQNSAAKTHRTSGVSTADGVSMERKIFVQHRVSQEVEGIRAAAAVNLAGEFDGALPVESAAATVPTPSSATKRSARFSGRVDAVEADDELPEKRMRNEDAAEVEIEEPRMSVGIDVASPQGICARPSSDGCGDTGNSPYAALDSTNEVEDGSHIDATVDDEQVEERGNGSGCIADRVHRRERKPVDYDLDDKILKWYTTPRFKSARKSAPRRSVTANGANADVPVMASLLTPARASARPSSGRVAPAAEEEPRVKKPGSVTMAPSPSTARGRSTKTPSVVPRVKTPGRELRVPFSPASDAEVSSPKGGSASPLVSTASAPPIDRPVSKTATPPPPRGRALGGAATSSTTPAPSSNNAAIKAPFSPTPAKQTLNRSASSAATTPTSAPSAAKRASPFTPKAGKKAKVSAAAARSKNKKSKKTARAPAAAATRRIISTPLRVKPKAISIKKVGKVGTKGASKKKAAKKSK